MLLTGVIDQHIDFSKFFKSRVHHTLTKHGVAKVALDGYGAASLRFNNGNRFPGVICFLQVDNDNIRALASEQRGHRSTYAAVSASDNRYFVPQARGTGVPRLPLRFGFEFALVSG